LKILLELRSERCEASKKAGTFRRYRETGLSKDAPDRAPIFMGSRVVPRDFSLAPEFKGEIFI